MLRDHIRIKKERDHPGTIVIWKLNIQIYIIFGCMCVLLIEMCERRKPPWLNGNIQCQRPDAATTTSTEIHARKCTKFTSFRLQRDRQTNRKERGEKSKRVESAGLRQFVIMQGRKSYSFQWELLMFALQVKRLSHISVLTWRSCSVYINIEVSRCFLPTVKKNSDQLNKVLKSC